MTSTIFTRFIKALALPRLRRRLLFIGFALLVFRFLSSIPVPGIDTEQVSRFFADNQFFSLLNIFSGGGLSSFSIVMLGIGPFITASIIMQLMTVLFPALKSMYHEEGEAGRRKFNYYSRLLTVPLAFIQGFSFLTLLSNQGVIPPMSLFEMGVNLVVITAGALIVMWIGELISEFGIGNGASILIAGGILATLPTILRQAYVAYDPTQLPVYIAFFAVTLLVIVAIIIVMEAERPIPITYAKQARVTAVNNTAVPTYVPLRLNQAGVMPIIFALSMLLFPQMILGFINTTTRPWLQQASDYYQVFTENLWLYGGAYFILVFLFTFFYTAITFEPHTMAENLQKSGAFVPGIRPGQQTEKFIGDTMTRITFIGAMFLGCIAILPIVLQSVTGLQALTLGGTSLLIVIGVAIDLAKRIDAQVSMSEY
jgi:preprotein translocase subunit SecY